MNKSNSVLLHHLLYGGRIKTLVRQFGIPQTTIHRILDKARKNSLYDWTINKKENTSDKFIGAYGEDIIKYILSLRQNQPDILDTKSATYKKVVVLPDIHYPDNINLSAVEDFLSDYKPDVLIYLGDVLDLRYLSKFDKDNKLIAKDKLREEYDAIMKLMDRHMQLSQASETYFIEGNHEFRVQKILESQPVGTGFVEIPEAMRLEERGIKWVEMNKWMKIGKLFFTHGLYYNMYHARKHVDTCQRNVIYGHTHSVQVHSGVHPYDKDLPHIAKSIGCLCDVNPAYMKNRPNQWMNSFLFAEIEADGTFTDTIVPVVKGCFRVPGLTSKRYEIN